MLCARLPGAFYKDPSGMWDASLPGHSCGGSGGFKPPSLLGLVSQATYDVAALLKAYLIYRNCQGSLICRSPLNGVKVAKGSSFLLISAI